MANPTNPHDKFFKTSMQNAVIAQQFFQYYLPERLSHGLDFGALKIENSTYIDESLQETISDLVFSCPYNDQVNDAKGDKRDVKISLLVEHQSTPDKLLAFRVFHYLFNMVHSLLKQRPKSAVIDKLPAVYALVFYHGKQTPYPYSLRLVDCFDDPLKVMKNLLENPVHLIDVNQVQDDEIKKQQLLGMMTGALKHSRDRDISRFLLQLRQSLNSMDLDDDLALKFLRVFLNYMLGVGNITSANQIIKVGQQLSEPVKGEFMTAAEHLKALGAEEAREETRGEYGEEVAINSLKEGAEPNFVARITGLDLAVILKLKTQLEDKS